MKNQYFGDVNDYRKYGLLRALSGVGELELCVAWMLTANDGGRDGRFRTYLREPSRWRGHDPQLYDFLVSTLADGADPSVGMIEHSSVLPGSTFFGDLVPDDRAGRQYWAERLQKAAAGADLVFLDPDNGFEVKSCPVGRQRSSKYAAWDEVARLYRAGSSVLVYQHFCREERESFTARLAGELAEHTGSCDVLSFSTPHVVFLLAARAWHADHFRRAAGDGLSHWAGQITGAAPADSIKCVQRNRDDQTGQLRLMEN